MKKFTESLQNSIFDDVELLENLLVEYKDISLTYNIDYQIQRTHGNHGYLYPTTRPMNKPPLDWDLELEVNVKVYIIRFSEMSDILTSDYQRGDSRRRFFIPPDKMYRFFEITEDIQNKVESFGYTFAINTRDSEFDIMILDGKFK